LFPRRPQIVPWATKLFPGRPQIVPWATKIVPWATTNGSLVAQGTKI
jgi:hypothetical protein